MYIKPGKTFKLSKTAKRMIALSGGTAEQRTQLKHMFIQAELARAVIIKREPREGKPASK
jgi:hypothetical protein